MKNKFTIALCALFIAAAFAIGCQKEPINPNPSTGISGATTVHAAANYPNGCCCSYHGMIEGQYDEAWVDGPFVWVPAHWGIVGYYGCGGHGGSIASGAIYPTLPTGMSAPTDTMSIMLTPGMQYSYYQHDSLIATVVSDGMGNVDDKALPDGTYNVVVYFDDAHKTGYMEMTLPHSGWLVKLDPQ